MYDYIFSPILPKKMPSISSTDVKFTELKEECIKIEEIKSETIFDIIFSSENKNKKLMLYEKNLPNNTWMIEGGLLKLFYDNLKKEMCTIYLEKTSNGDCLTYLLENRIIVSLKYQNEQFILSYVEPTKKMISLRGWEWVPIEIIK